MSKDALEIVIPDVDVKSGLALCDGEVKIYLQSLYLFTGNIPEALGRIRNVTADALGDYTVSVHGIKGMCSYIGAEDARKVAKQLEEMAKNGDLEGVLARNGNFILHVENIIANIQSWLKSNEANLVQYR